MHQSILNTASELRRLYSNSKAQEELSGEWGVVVLYRRPSFIISAFLIRLSITANSITLLSIALSLSLGMVVFLDAPFAYYYLSAAGVIICILDCVDGNIARMAGPTRRGQYLDFLADIVYRVSIYTAFGYTLQTTAVNSGWLAQNAMIICIFAAILSIISRLCRVYTENRFSTVLAGAAASENGKPHNKRIDIALSFISGLDSLLPVFILLVALLDIAHWLVVWLFFYSLLDFVYTQIMILSDVK